MAFELLGGMLMPALDLLPVVDVFNRQEMPEMELGRELVFVHLRGIRLLGMISRGHHFSPGRILRPRVVIGVLSDH